MIDPSSLPCYAYMFDTSEVFLISSIEDGYDDIRYLHDGSWVCSESDNPQVLITLAEIALYFPERLI